MIFSWHIKIVKQSNYQLFIKTINKFKKLKKMKTKAFITILFVLLAGISYGQKNLSTIEILTNPHCHSSKEKIEKELTCTQGVENAILNMNTKILVVNFDSDEISKKEILNIVEKLGYNATPVQNRKNCKSEHSCHH